MSGWRDQDGNTAAERRKLRSEQDRATFADTVRRRPLSLVRPILGALFVAILVFALLTWYG
jgi:hypothetical protein